MEEVRTYPVILVDESDAGDVVIVRLAPHRLRLWLYAGYGIENCNCAVKNTQRSFDLSGEVDMTRRIDYLYDVALPEACGRSGRDGNAALLLLHHPVHDGLAIVDLADFVRLARVVKNAFRRSCLTCIDVSHDADVAQLLQTVLSFCHVNNSSDLTRNDSARRRG